MASLLIVESKDGAQVAVEAAYFRRKLEPDGWRAVAYENGEPYAYEPPAKRADSAVKADEAKAEG
jgi:hypothetical protein